MTPTVGRTWRLLQARWRRVVRWEFWPPWVFYPPVLLYVLWLGLRHRGPTRFTAANPAIPSGGFAGESKVAILTALAAASPEAVARFELLPGGETVGRRRARVLRFLRRQGLSFPVVLKPDVGERGRGVVIVRRLTELRAALAGPDDLIVQEYVPGEEFGVFYARYPQEATGRVLSITRKSLPVIEGDGRRTVEQLILDREELRGHVPLYRRQHRSALARVLQTGERLALTDVGNHCRGAIFTDATLLTTPALEAKVDSIAQGFAGFHVGRFDVRVPSAAALARGDGIRVLELNGVAAEQTHIYDAGFGLFDAYRALFAQWRLLFDVAAANIARGARALTVPELAAIVGRHVRELSVKDQRSPGILPRSVARCGT